MNAIRRDEELDNLHSVYVDQWDWEKIITSEIRTIDTLYETVRSIVKALRESQSILVEKWEQLSPVITNDVTFITAQELEDMYPELSPQERENAICKEYGVVFINGIGGKLNSGVAHDGRAPDYDDWNLNGDLLVYYPLLERAVEISSMGIRVDEQSLKNQLEIAGCSERASLPFHSELLSGNLPLTMGGGLGQSRICMLMLQKAHIVEVQSSVWSDQMHKDCASCGIHLL